MAFDSSSESSPLPIAYREKAHSKSEIAPLTSSCALAGTYTLPASIWPGFDCSSVVISVQATTPARTRKAVRIRMASPEEVEGGDEASERRRDCPFGCAGAEGS